MEGGIMRKCPEWAVIVLWIVVACFGFPTLAILVCAWIEYLGGLFGTK
jgi:hypothetical protein